MTDTGEHQFVLGMDRSPAAVDALPPPAGLTERQAAERLADEGRNELLVAASIGWLAALGRQLADVMILVLLAAAALTAAVGDFPDMAVILLVVVINSILGAGQEVRSGQALTALAQLTAPRASVVRSGVARDVDAREVVRGDVIRVAAGDIVAADARLSEVESLQADESMLTGESTPVAKLPGDQIFAGTVVTRGRATAEVTATAETTAVGGIARSVRDSRLVPTPVQRQLAVLGRRLALVVAVAALAVGGLNLLAGRGLETSLVLAISLAVAAIPESLPAVVSLSLAMAARRMAARGALARRLAAVEALGSVTVIATDKTGTLTTGRMSLADTWTPSADPTEHRRLLEAAVLCNDAYANGEEGERDDPTEIALIIAALDVGLDIRALRAANPRIGEIPFDAGTARMSTVHALSLGGERELVKGSPEAVLGGVASAPGAQDAADRLAASGQRTLAVAARDDGQWRLLGVLGLADPPRDEAGQTIAAFRRAGVRPVMITGDHPSTAAAIADQVGISTTGGVAIGADWAGRESCNVFARIRPDEKMSIVSGLQARNEVVAMTGDGVNDAPALRAADIGIAMGQRGTEVAKQAADIVLTTDDLSAMVPAIGEGRRVYDNLRRFLHYGLSGGVAEVLIMLFGPLAGFSLPLRSGQILWVNLLTHGLPGVAMGNEPAAADVLTRAPRPPREQLLDLVTARRVGVLGVVIAGAALLAGAYARHEGRPWQSTIFLALAFAQLAVALALRPRHRAGARNWMLDAAVAVNAVLAVLAVWWRPLRELLRTELLAPRDVLPCLIAAAVAALVARWQITDAGGHARGWRRARSGRAR
jgi:P-type Ca2+ transporter type 2C